MDTGSKVAVAILAAAVLLVVAFVGYREFDRARDVREATEAVNQMAQWPAQFEAEQRQQADQSRRRRQARSLADRKARALAPDMQCVGGVVIRVSGASYTQLGTVGNPVRCSGRLADQPIR